MLLPLLFKVAAQLHPLKGLFISKQVLMKLKKKVVILTEGQVKSLMDNLRVERDKRILSEINSLSNKQSKVI